MSTELKASEILIKARDLIQEKGLCRFGYSNSTGQHCMIGAIYDSKTIKDNFEYKATPEYYLADAIWDTIPSILYKSGNFTSFISKKGFNGN